MDRRIESNTIFLSKLKNTFKQIFFFLYHTLEQVQVLHIRNDDTEGGGGKGFGMEDLGWIVTRGMGVHAPYKFSNFQC